MRILMNKSQLILVSTNMSENAVLTQPKFIKVKDIESGRSGYNVYVKIVSVDRKQVDTRDGKKIAMVNCVVADETASANAFFKGDSANIIEKDNVIAIRNGVKRFVKDHISLEIDLFGRVTLEKNVNIAATSNNNISEVQHKLSDKPRRERRDNKDNRDNRNRDRPRRDNYRNDGQDKPRRNDRREPREDRKDREPREQREPKEQRQPRENRQPREYKEERREHREPRENQEKKEYVRRDNQERREQPRGERREYNNDRRGDYNDKREYNNNNRRDYGDRRNNERNLDRPRRDDRDFDRTNKGDRHDGFNKTENRPRYEEKRGDDTRERRAPLTWNKVSSITPGEDGLNLTVKVISAQRVGARFRCVLGDETGITHAFLPESEFLHEGEIIVLFNARSEVVKEHIEIQLDRKGRIEKSRRDVKGVNEEFNLSQKAWVPIE